MRPQLLLVIYTAGFLLEGDYDADACGVLLVYDDSVAGRLVPETWRFTRDDTEHTHLGFRFPAGSFTVTDYADPQLGLRGCTEHDFDPVDFPDGFPAAVLARDWGFGLGTLDADLVDQVDGDPDYADVDDLLQEGWLVGGSMLTRADPPYDPRWFTRGSALDAQGRAHPDQPLSAAQMAPAPPADDTGIESDEALVPHSGAYVVFPPTWVGFSALW
ncbi:MAG: hypothetical protein R3F59_11975 [Myxococcota bacterium]